MFILFPHKVFNRITDIPISFIKERKIDTVILDVDNTLTTHDNPTPADGVMEWLRSAENSNLNLIILSNNSPSRVEPFAKMLKLKFESNAKKPLTGGFKRIFERFNTNKEHCCVIGDQLFTDVLGGRLSGCYTIMVNLIEPEKTNFFKFKRFLERILMRFYKND